MDSLHGHDELLGNNVEHNSGETIAIQVTKGQFWSGIVAILTAVGAFGLTMRGDVTALQRDVLQIRKDVDTNRLSAERANEKWHEANVRLARIETMLDQGLKILADRDKEHGERLTKIESWRDGPQARPEAPR